MGLLMVTIGFCMQDWLGLSLQRVERLADCFCNFFYSFFLLTIFLSLYVISNLGRGVICINVSSLPSRPTEVSARGDWPPYHWHEVSAQAQSSTTASLSSVEAQMDVQEGVCQNS